jgi:hypothetical protein
MKPCEVETARASSFERPCPPRTMVSTRRVVSLLTPEEKIAHLALDPDHDLLAWVEGSRSVHLGRLNEE